MGGGKGYSTSIFTCAIQISNHVGINTWLRRYPKDTSVNTHLTPISISEDVLVIGLRLLSFGMMKKPVTHSCDDIQAERSE